MPEYSQRPGDCQLKIKKVFEPWKSESLASREPPDWGTPLNEDDYRMLEGSWITRDIADSAQLRRVSSLEGCEIVGHKGKRDCAGVLIPYYWAGQISPFNHRIRRDNPDWTADKDGRPNKQGKYLGPPNGANRLYIPPGVTLEQLADVQIPIALVEGEKKALGLWRLANHEIEQARFIPIAIAGVWNWRGRIGKTGGPRGERLDVKGPIPDLNRIEWNGRKVFVIFDANVHTNKSVKWARSGISRELATRGAKVDFVNLPEGCGVNGIDDLLAIWGPEKVLELFRASVSGARMEITLRPQFQSRPDGLFRVTTRGEKLTQEQLTNYQAAIVANIRLDDGVETKCEFEIATELMSRKQQFTIPASEFISMDWPIERMGAAAITFPNKRDYARTAIQSLSMGAGERCVYTHTGWRMVDGRWIYLHAGGAITDTGAVADVNVRLVGQMSCYKLCLPACPEALTSAIRASLKLAELGPPTVSLPLLAATYRAVLGDSDFSIHLAGETGAFKSELAALHQQHFGAAMDRLHLPGAWSSTGNALETLAFHGKDTLVVIDDFAPQGNSTDVARYHAAADRLFRGAGNQAGRSRLDSTATLREPKPPRALVLSTGEDVPRGHSIRARLLVLELSKNNIKSAALTESQDDARAGRFAEAMGAYVRWLAGRYDAARARFEILRAECRSRALRIVAHARTPDLVANLQAGFELFLEFCLESGVIDTAERKSLRNRCWTALGQAAATQAKHQLAAEPAAQFLALVRSLLTSGRAHLEARNGGEPTEFAGSCGWRHDKYGDWTPSGDCIGWITDADVYLEPATAFRLVQVAGRDMGEALSISEHTLRKRLQERRFLASVDQARETLTVRRSIGGTSKNVLHFLRSTILQEVSDANEDAA